MSLAVLKNRLNQMNLSPSFGEIIEITQTTITACGLDVGIGDIVNIYNDLGKLECGMVTKVKKNEFFVTPFSFIEGFKIGDKISLECNGLNIGVGDELLGRIIDPLGRALDDKPQLKFEEFMPIIAPPIKAMNRGMIDSVLSTGVKSIDGLLTCGRGQKLGIFAGSGVGKSTLMSMIVKGVKEDAIKIIALIGERGREVPEFINKHLGGDLRNTIIIIATSDDSPLMRKYGAFSAMAIAEYFKNKGREVLFIMDSVTRFAMAQREIGLSLGEPPTSKGYPPSALSILPQLMERAGKEIGKGCITAFFTVLVEGDDLSDPIADQSRSILDGHIVLSRELTEGGLYPPIDVLKSASRVMDDIIDDNHKRSARKFKKLYSLYKEKEMLIHIGSYKMGSDSAIDEAINKKELMNNFLMQEENLKVNFEDCVDELEDIMK